MQQSSPFSAQLDEHVADLMRCVFAYRETLVVVLPT